MAMSNAQLEKLARSLADKIYISPNQTAIADLPTVVAAIQSVDTAMNATGQQIVTAGYGTTALKVAMFQEMQKSIPGITVNQAAIALALWALEEAGLL